jgi:hypothetical protein
VQQVRHPQVPPVRRGRHGRPGTEGLAPPAPGPTETDGPPALSTPSAAALRDWIVFMVAWVVAWIVLMTAGILVVLSARP